MSYDEYDHEYLLGKADAKKNGITTTEWNAMEVCSRITLNECGFVSRKEASRAAHKFGVR